MLFIFDLDDTLIDTFHSITVRAYKALIVKIKKKHPLQIDADKALASLIEYRTGMSSSRSAMKSFFVEYNIQMNIESALDFVYSFNDYPEAVLNPGVYDFLKEISQEKSVIVTRGIESRQLEKIQKSLLSSFFFERIIVVGSEDKSEAYKDVLQQFRLEKSILVADREEDFKDTQGLITKRVLFVPSYFKRAKSEFFVDLEISNLKDLRGVL